MIIRKIPTGRLEQTHTGPDADGQSGNCEMNFGNGQTKDDQNQQRRIIKWKEGTGLGERSIITLKPGISGCLSKNSSVPVRLPFWTVRRASVPGGSDTSRERCSRRGE